MCQSKSEGGRRCSCDSSQSRQSRRVAQKIRSSVASTAVEVQNTSSNPAVLEENASVPPSLEVIKEKAQRVQKKVDQMRTGMIPAHVAEKEVTQLGVLIASRAEADVDSTGIAQRVEEYSRIQASFTEDFIKPRQEQKDQLIRRSKELNKALKRGSISSGKYNEDFASVKKEFDTIQNEIAEKAEALRTEYELPIIAYRQELAKKYQEILSQIRDYGGDLNMLSADSKNTKQGKLLQQQMETFPSSWIKSAHAWEVRVKKTTARAHYSQRAMQTKSKIVPDTEVSAKSPDWRPDPNNPEHAGYVRLTSIQPEDMRKDAFYVKQSAYNLYTSLEKDGDYAYWVKPAYSMRATYPGDPPPKGRGWEYSGDVAGHAFGTSRTVSTWKRKKSKKITLETYAMAELTISERNEGSFLKPGADVAMHEFSHHVESTHKGITQLEEAFLKRRTTLASGEREKKTALYGREYVRKDNFVHAYMGKEYPDSSREVLSTGQEALFSGTFGGLIGHNGYKEDPDMRGFILGLHASA